MKLIIVTHLNISDSKKNQQMWLRVSNYFEFYAILLKDKTRALILNQDLFLSTNHNHIFSKIGSKNQKLLLNKEITDIFLISFFPSIIRNCLHLIRQIVKNPFKAYRSFLFLGMIILIMFVLQKIRTTVSKIDMFSSSEMLRYNDDAHYQTFTGGIFSLGIILTVIAGFFSMISQTLNRTAITSSLNVITSSDPTAYNLTSNADNMFMFGIQIQSTDLTFFYDINGPRRYFDVTAILGALKYGVIESVDLLNMVQCTDEHWKMIPELVKNKNLLLYDTWLCPQIGSQYLIQGTFVSNIYNQVRISVSKCTNESDPSRPCYPQNQIDDLMAKHGNFYFTVNYINTVINPNQVTYRSYYLQPMDYVIFSETQGSEIYYLFSDYKIQTDTSIWPFSSFSTDTGAIVPSKAKGISFTVGEDGEYVGAYITKASQSLSYKRQVQKLSIVFSYIGGLVGAISAILFILKSYTGTSLEIALAKNLFKEEETIITETGKNQPQKQEGNSVETSKINKVFRNDERFSLVTFIKLHIYRLFKDFKCTENWTGAKEIEEFREEIGKHLDIQNLLKRIINLERYLSYQFDEKQLSCLKHQKQINFQQIKQLRQFFSNQIHDELNQIQQPAIAKNKIYKIDVNLCNQLIESSVNNPSIMQSSQPMCLTNERKEQFQVERQKSLRLSTEKNKEIIKQYFKDLEKFKETNVLNRRIWQNAKKQYKQSIQEIVDKQQLLYSKTEKLMLKKSSAKITFPFVESFE